MKIIKMYISCIISEEEDEEDEPGHEDLSQYVESLVAKSNHKT